MSSHRLACSLAAAMVTLAIGPSFAPADEPPAINPFGQTSSSEREDAVPGRLELSDGSAHTGLIYLTRDKRLQIYDEACNGSGKFPCRQSSRSTARSRRNGWSGNGSSRRPPATKRCTRAAVIRSREYIAHDHAQERPHHHRRAVGHRLPSAADARGGPVRRSAGRAGARAVPVEQTQQGRGRSGLEIPGLRQADQVGQSGDGRGE